MAAIIDRAGVALGSPECSQIDNPTDAPDNSMRFGEPSQRINQTILRLAGDQSILVSTASVYTNTKHGSFPAIAIFDIDGDGRNDLVIADAIGGSITILLQSRVASGQFLPPVRYALPAGTGLSVVVADLNGDGHPDLVCGGSARLAVLLQDPTHPGAFPAATTYPAPLGATALAVADINGDGLPDIVTESGTSSTVVNELLRTPPGVLYQNPSKPGSFQSLENLE